MQDEIAHHVAPELLWIPILLLAAKLTGALAERFRQPAVLGELAAGVILGNLTLIGITALSPIATDEIVRFLAELGVILLLFQIGLESSLDRMRRVGARALAVAVIGVVVPFALGALVGPLVLPGLSTHAYLFIGAALTATSVGITARVFSDIGALDSIEAQIVLGAAVIDDVLGLIILAVVSALATAGTVSAAAIGWIVASSDNSWRRTSADCSPAFTAARE
jgi:Kef-type K+ transport system membrane component KefB